MTDPENLYLTRQEEKISKLSQRQRRDHHSVDDCYRRIFDASETFQVYYGTIRATTTNDSSTKDVFSSVEMLMEALTADPEDKATTKPGREFLRKVDRECGREVAFLCAMGLRKHKLEHLNKGTKNNLLRRLKENKAKLLHAPLIRFMNDYELPNDAIKPLEPEPKPQSVFYDPVRNTKTNI